jgi:hypothetical protein
VKSVDETIECDDKYIIIDKNTSSARKFLNIYAMLDFLNTHEEIHRVLAFTNIYDLKIEENNSNEYTIYLTKYNLELKYKVDIKKLYINDTKKDNFT